MIHTYYTKAHLDREARLAVCAFRRTLPKTIRRSVKADGWGIRVGNETALVAYFTDENGRHELSLAI